MRGVWRLLAQLRGLFFSCAFVGFLAITYWWVGGHFNPAESDSPDPAANATSLEDDLPLPAAEREYLWEIEHHGNILNQLGFKALSRALRGGDATELTRLLAAPFEGKIPAQTEEVKWEEDLVQVSRQTAVGQSFQILDRTRFVEHLLSLRRLFSRPPRVQISLMKLSPCQRGQMDGPWKGSCLLRMSGFWAESKPAEVILNVDFRLERPTEARIAAGSWLQGCTIVQSQVGKAEKFLFRDVTAERGIDPDQFHDNWKSARFSTQTGGVYLCDFNRDGRLDMLITDGVGDKTNLYLYQGLEGGKFRDVTTAMGLPRTIPKTLTFAWMDIDGDGWEDLVLYKRVYRNDHGQRFVDYSDRCDLPFPDGAAALVADFDRDGKLDLYVTANGTPTVNSWLSGQNAGGIRNYLFRNKGNWQFEDVTLASGTTGGNRSVFTAAWLDANNDGWPDLYVINEFGDGVLLVNRHDGTFAEQRLADRPSDFGSMGLAAGDLDNDGNIDLFVAAMYSKAGSRVIANLKPDAYPPDIMHKIRNFVQGNQLHRNLGGLKFEQLGSALQVNASGWAFGPALVDLNNDGWLDIFSTAGFISQSRDDPDG